MLSKEGVIFALYLAYTYQEKKTSNKQNNTKCCSERNISIVCFWLSHGISKLRFSLGRWKPDLFSSRALVTLNLTFSNSIYITGGDPGVIFFFSVPRGEAWV